MAELGVKYWLTTTLHLLLYSWNYSLLPFPRPVSTSEIPGSLSKVQIPEYYFFRYFDLVDLGQVLPGSETGPNQCITLETQSEIRSFFIQQIFV